MKKHHTTFILDTKEVDRDAYTVTGVFSSEIEDRHGEIVVQDGWDLENYMRNAVVLFGHNHWDLPVGKMVKLGIETVDGKKYLSGTIKFAVEEYDFAKTLFNLYAGGFMKAFSVGFRNLDNSIEYDEETNESTIYLTRNELLEVSCVPIPANAEALVKAAASGIDLKPYKKSLEKIKEDERPAVFTELHAKALVDVIDILKRVDGTIGNKQATDTEETQDAVQKSGKTASPSSKGSEANKNATAHRVLRGKAIHRINRAIRTLNEVKGNL